MTMFWTRVTKFDLECVELADGHYSRRTPGSSQFMPPGQTVVLHASGAVFGWWRPHPASGLKSMNGLDGWTCTIFRNTSALRSSGLILEAEYWLTRYTVDCGPDGLLTYVWDSKIRSSNPGCCFKKAGWHVRGRSADGRKTLLHKPFNAAGTGANELLARAVGRSGAAP